jgi:type IV secretion system protein VirB9
MSASSTKKLLFIALMVPLVALAEVTPPKGALDPRVRVLDYDPRNVVRIATFYGVSTHIQLGTNEVTKDVAVGDDLAWKVVPRGNHLFIKPIAANADTNVTVVTNKRTYQFALVVQPRPAKDSTAWADPNLIFSLSFEYPDEEAAQADMKAEAAAVKARLDQVKSRLSDAAKAGQNFDYWVAGSPDISPTSARDDGRFIYLAFNNNRDMPAVYTLDEKGEEALVNTNVIDGNTIVIQRLVRRLVLRKGSSVASVVNRSFDLEAGENNTTGTVSPLVERAIKETAQ